MSNPETQQPVGLSDIVLSRRTLAWHCGATRETLRAARWLGSNVMVRQYAMSQHIGEATSNSAASQASQERHNRRLRYKSKDYPRHYNQNPNRVPQTCPVIGLTYRPNDRPLCASQDYITELLEERPPIVNRRWCSRLGYCWACCREA